MAKTILFLHGFLGHKQDFDALISYLSEFDCTAINWSSKEDLPFEPYAYVGYSMGGRLALSLKSTKKVIISGHTGLKSEKERSLRWQKDLNWIELLKTLPFDAFLKRWYSQSIFKGFTFPEYRMQQDPLKLAQILAENSLAKQICYTDFQNTLFLCGRQDLKYLEHYRTLPHFVLEGGHALHLENPKACAEKIREFL